MPGLDNSVIKDNEESALDRGFYSAALGFENNRSALACLTKRPMYFIGVAKLCGKRDGLHSDSNTVPAMRGGLHSPGNAELIRDQRYRTNPDAGMPMRD